MVVEVEQVEYGAWCVLNGTHRWMAINGHVRQPRSPSSNGQMGE